MIILFESFVSSAINIIIDGSEYVFTLMSGEDGVYLMDKGIVYQRLDIDIPDSDELNDDEFFMSPEVREEVVEELLSQGFIQKIDKESTAGDEKVIGYKL